MTRTLSHADATIARPDNGGLFARAQKSFAQYRLYRKTLAELEALNDRELRDLGLSRYDLRTLAYDSVYGA